jgi:hypothetical protein
MEEYLFIIYLILMLLDKPYRQVNDRKNFVVGCIAIIGAMSALYMISSQFSGTQDTIVAAGVPAEDCPAVTKV